MLLLSLGIIVGILLSIVAMLSRKIGAFLESLPAKVRDSQAHIVQTKDPIDSLDL